MAIDKSLGTMVDDYKTEIIPGKDPTVVVQVGCLGFLDSRSRLTGAGSRPLSTASIGN